MKAKNSNKPAPVIELTARDHAIIALAKVKQANKGKTFVRVKIPQGYKEVEAGKYKRRNKPFL